jgi:hypothetical protein
MLRTALALAAFGLIVVGVIRPVSQPAQAAAGINKTINFQGRLLNATGAVIPDGNYNFRFKVYQDGPGNVAGDTGGTLMWTELWQNSVATGSSAGVVVKNGYFSVALGTYCAFAGGSCQGATNTAVDFNQDTLWLSMDVGGTAVSNTPTYDGELLPMKRMSSAVYALNANQLGGLTASQFAQLSPGSAQSGFLNVTGSVQAASLQAPLVDNTGTLGIGTNASTTAVTVGRASSSVGLTLQGSNSSTWAAVGASGTTTIAFNAPTANTTLKFPASAAGTYTICTTDAASCSATYQAAGSYLVKNAADTSSAAITATNYLYGFSNSSSAVASGVLKLDNGSNTGNALYVTASGNPGAGSALIVANTTAGSPSGNLIDLQVSGVSKLAVDSSGNIVQTGNTTTTDTINGQRISSAANFSGTVTSASAITVSSGGVAVTGNSTVAGTLGVTVASSSSAFTVSDGSSNILTADTQNSRVTVGGTAINGSRLSVVSASTTVGISVNSQGTGDNLDLYNNGTAAANLVFSVGNAGKLFARTNTNDANGFSFQNSSGTYLLNGDTTNNFITNNGTTAPGNILQNPGFESGPFTSTNATASGWVLTSPVSVVVDNTNANSGNNELQVAANGTTINIPTAEYFEVQPGEKYYAEVWAKSSSGGTGTASLSFAFYDKDKGASAFSSATSISPGTTYTKYTASGTVPSGTGRQYMRVFLAVQNTSTTGTTWYFDDPYAARVTQQQGIEFTSSSGTDINRASGALTLQGTGGITLTAGTTNAITVDAAGAGSVLLGNTNATTVTLGNTGSTTTSIQGGTAINIGTGTSASALTLGGASGIVTLQGTTKVTLGAVSANAAAVCRDTSTSALIACDSTNTTGRAFLQGGNTLGAAGNLGTNDANDLNLRTNSTTRLVVGASGGVTIGASGTPTGNLSFATGSDQVINVLTAASGNNGNNLTVQAGSGNGTNKNGGNLVLQGGNNTGNGTPGSVITKPQSDVAGAFQVQNAAGTISVLSVNTALQRASINTTSPQGILDVYQATLTVGTVSNSAASANVTGTSTLFLSNFAIGDVFTITSTGNSCTIQTITDDTHIVCTATLAGTSSGSAYTVTQSSRFNVWNNGNVGIGIASPSSRLTIQGGEIAEYWNGKDPRIILGDTGTTNDYGFVGWNSLSNYIRLDTDGTNGLKVQGNNVSIGNIFPGDPLNVGLGSVSLLKVATSTGAVTIKPNTSSDSATEFQIQNAAASATILDVDTSAQRVGINTTAPGTDLAFGSGAARTISVNQAASGNNGDDLAIQAGSGNGTSKNGGTLLLQGGNNTSGGTAGGVTVKPQTDTSAAFRVQNAAATATLFNVNTSTSTITFTNDTIDLDSSTIQGAGLSGDCSSSNSKLLWSSSTKQFSCGTDRASASIRKTANETDPSSNTLQNDDAFTFSVGTSETWAFQIYGRLNSNATANFKAAIAAPAGSTCEMTMFDMTQGTDLTTTSCGTTTGSFAQDTTDHAFTAYGTVVTSGTSGSITFQWAQNTSNAYVTTVYAGGYMVAYKISGADVAEVYYSKDNSITPGDVVSVDGSVNAGVKKSQGAYDPHALGIVSTQPGVVLGDDSVLHKEKPVVLALAGRVPVKVTTENGSIAAGDYLTSSATRPGYAMKATSAGQVIGQALADYTDDAPGEVMTFVKPGFYPGSTDIAGLQGGDHVASSDMTLSGKATIGRLDVTGNATVTGSLTVAGPAAVGELQVAGGIKLGASNEDLSNEQPHPITKHFRARKPLAAGTVVVADYAAGWATTTAQAGDKRVIGIAVTTAAQAGDVIDVAIGGTAKAAISGDAAIGDLLHASAEEGKAAKVDAPTTGELVGKALSPPDQNGQALILVALQ